MINILNGCVVCVCFVDVVCPFALFLLAIVLSVRLRYTDFDYPFGIFKLFLTLLNIKYNRNNILQW